MNRRRLLPSSSLKLFGDVLVTEVVFVKIKQVQAQPVLHFALAQIMQVRLPVPVLPQVPRYMLRQKNMPGIAAIEHPLRDVDCRSGQAGFVVNIGNSINLAAVNPHSQLDARMLLHGFADFERTSYRFLGTVEKNECHPVSGRHPDKFSDCVRRSETIGASNDLIQFLQYLNLLIVR